MIKLVLANFQITSESDTHRRSQRLQTMDEIQTLIFDPAFGDSSTSCSEEDSSSDDSDSEYDLSDPEVGMNQASSDTESGCSELELEDTLLSATSDPSAADKNVAEIQKQEVAVGHGPGG